ELGVLGMLRPTLAEELYEVKAEIWLGEIALPEPAERRYSPIGRYPGVRRDVSVLVDAQVPYARLARDAAQALPPEAKLRLIDVYAGKGVPEGKVSYTLSVFYRHPERTLTDEEVNAWHERLVKALREKGYLIRGLDA
ncbi:phenylalanine--tRNA ligase subunit beta, partial [Candidatus Bathyarchaeota archaeon]